jgi:hypothetical protein
MSTVRTPLTVAMMMLASVVMAAEPQNSGEHSKAETEVYVAVFRAVIDQRLAHDSREGLAFFLSLSPADKAGLPVRPGSQAVQPQPMREVVDSKTMLPGIRVVLNRVTWASETETIVYCELYSHGKDAEGKLMRLRYRGGEWSITSVEPKWKS